MPSPLFEGLGLASGFSGDPEPDVKPFFGAARGKYDQVADLRDALAGLVGSGSRTMNDDMRANFARIQAMYGRPLAEKLLNHVFVFNSRPDMARSGAKDRIDAFYSTGSKDKELQNLFLQAKAFGKGPLAGLNESSNQESQVLSGRLLAPPARAVPTWAKKQIVKTE